MFDYMSNSQIAALILGIVFSIIAIATTCLAFKYASKFNSFAKAISMALVAPFIAFVSWLFLIFSYLDGFREDEVLNLIISILLAVIICGMIIIVARALYNKHEDEFVLADQAEAEAKAKIAEVEAENTETNVENENTEETIKQPLLIESSLTNENEVEEQPVESDNSEEQTESEVEEADENNDEESVESEENQEETVEENNDEVAEDNKMEENADVETDAAEETASEEVETEETEEPATEENTDEITDETVEENTEDDSTTEEDDEDLEFEKFLEALREKAKAESENKDSNDTDEE